MKAPEIFDLIVRLVGFFTVMFAVSMVLAMFPGPLDITFMGIVYALAYAALGVVVMKASPMVTEFCYPPSRSRRAS